MYTAMIWLGLVLRGLFYLPSKAWRFLRWTPRLAAHPKQEALNAYWAWHYFKADWRGRRHRLNVWRRIARLERETDVLHDNLRGVYDDIDSLGYEEISASRSRNELALRIEALEQMMGSAPEAIPERVRLSHVIGVTDAEGMPYHGEDPLTEQEMEALGYRDSVADLEERR